MTNTDTPHRPQTAPAPAPAARWGGASARGARRRVATWSGASAVSLVLLAAFTVAGCGQERPGAEGADAPGAAVNGGGTSASGGGTTDPARDGGTAPGTPRPGASDGDFPCPGETRTESPSASPAAGDSVPGDMPPDYADNHAFQQAAVLHGQDRCDGLAEVRRTTAALEKLRTTGTVGDASVHRALTAAGYPASSITTTYTYEDTVGVTVKLPRACVDATVGGTQRATAEAHGTYREGTGCVRPVGGH